MNYNKKDIEEAYIRLGIKEGMTIALKTDLRLLGPYYSKKKEQVLSDHFEILSNIINLKKGTIVISTATTSLCNTDKPFDIEKTPSEMGSLTEFIRNTKYSRRSLHPFNSYAAIGKHSKFICNYFNRHSVGPNTPEEKLIELNAKYLSVGVHPKDSSTLIHHIEKTVGVPYRYIKEFTHPIVVKNKIIYEKFYLNVRHRESKITMNLDKEIFPYFKKKGYKIHQTKLGRGKIYLFSAKEFYDSSVELLQKNLYACLDGIPKIKPYTD